MENVRWKENRVFESSLDFNDENDRAVIVELYKKWVMYDEYVVIRQIITDFNKNKMKYLVVKAVKRGNDVYNRMAKEHLRQLVDVIRRCDLGNDGYTKMLYVTLTYNSNRCDMVTAWLNIGKEWNNFLSNLKRAYGGRVDVFRSWESFDNGYPHIHALLYFPNHRFIWIKHTNDKGFTTYRIPKSDKDKLAGYWHSFVDVQAVTNKNKETCLYDVLCYVAKYQKEHMDNPETWSKKELLTLSATWFFGLRAWSVSGTFVTDLTSVYRVIQTITLQTNLYGNIITTVTYEFVGMVVGSVAGVPGSCWVKIYPEPPDWLSQVWIPKRIKKCYSALRNVDFK